jgi:hypothetical protein
VNLATPAGQAARAAAIAQVTRSQNELAAATRRVIQAEAAQVQAETVHTAVVNESAVASARAAEVEARAAVARTQHALTNIQAKIAVAEQNGALKTREALLRSQITLEGRLAARQTALTAATNASAAAMNRATISGRLLAAAGRGLQSVWAMLGGGWGLAFMAATYGVYKLSTAESDAERINRKYSDAIAEATERMKKYRGATDDAAEGMSTWNQAMLLQMDKDTKEAEEKTKNTLKAVLAPESFVRLANDTKRGMDNGAFTSIFEKLPEDIKKDWMELMASTELGAEEFNKKLDWFSKKWLITTQKMSENTSLDPDVSLGYEQLLIKVHQMENGLDKNGDAVVGLGIKWLALTDTLNKTTEALDANKKSVGESFDEFLRRLQEDEDDIAAVFDRLVKAGVNLSNLNFFDLSDQIESVNKSTASYKEALTKFIDVLSSKESEVRKRLEGEEAGGKQYEQLLAMAEHYASLRLMVERELASGLLVIKAAEVAEFQVLEAEKEKGAKLETEERKKLLLEYARAYFESNESQIASEKEKSIRLLEIQSACIRQMLENLHTLAMAGDGAANSIYESMIGNYTMGQEALEAARAEYKKWRDESEGRQAELIDSLKDKLGGMGEGSGGGGGGGPATDAAKDAKEAVKALEEVELTLARMKGDKLKVVELESLKELRSFTDLLEKAGVAGEEAAGMIREFKAAQAATVETESLRSQLEFYEKIKTVVPEARDQYELLREKLLELEAVQLEMQGIPPAMVDIYIDTERLAEATDALSGIRRAVRDYTADLTPAQLAEEMFSSSISSISDALTEGIWNVDSFGDAMSNLGDTIIKALQKMMVEMLIVRPIMEVFSSMLDSLKAKSAGGGGFFGFLGGLFGFGHSGGIIGAGTLPKKLVSPLAFAGAQRFHSGGIIPGLKSKEIPIIARQGEVILTQAQQRQLLNILDGKSGYGSNAGVELNVSVVNQTSVKVDAETRTKQNQDGSGMDVTVLLKEIDDGLAKRQSQGNSSMDRQIRSTYQLNDAMSVYRGG